MKNNGSFPLSEKYIDFINSVKNVSADYLEGTTASGKTTVGAGIKFMRMVSMSDKKLHVISAATVGKAEETIINKDNGIIELHSDAKYYGNGDKENKLPHIKFEGKTIYVLGYSRRDQWEMVLGAQFGCVLIDEINIADIDFVREVSTRNDYLIATLNPDNPDLPVYKEFINRARPYKKYVNDVPESILKELKEEPNPLWRYWFFSFYDNKGLTDEDIQAKIDAAPKGTKLYKNKILGLRGKATGLVFQNFERSRHVISKEAVKRFFQSGKISFIHFTAGLDTAYSSKSDDTISMIFAGVTQDRKLIILDEKVYNNRYLSEPVAPSDTAKNFIDFLERSRNEFGLARNVFVDSADQATITELNKYKRENPCVYIFNNSYKKLKIIDRITLQLGWLHTDDYLVCDCCKNHIGELECYCWNDKRDNEPEDANDHTINAAQYAWIPYKDEIGTKELNSK